MASSRPVKQAIFDSMRESNALERDVVEALHHKVPRLTAWNKRSQMPFYDMPSNQSLPRRAWHRGL